jgi:cytochrome c-type biogenesis protein CcmH/NrfG
MLNDRVAPTLGRRFVYHTDVEESPMNRWIRLVLPLVLGVVALPVAIRAQEPKDNKWTKDATRYVGLAALKQAPADQAPLYQQALTSLQEGMQKDPTNPKVWLMAGEVYAGLENFNAADSAFQKAIQLHPEYADEIDGQREQMWLKLFQAGVASMDKQQNDDAIAKLEHAQAIYPKRPEALLNLGVLYTSKSQPDKAATAFRQAIVITHSPIAEKLTPEQKAQWKSFEDMANLSLAQMEATAGIDAFQAQKYTEAADAFRRALKINPHSRDYAYNLAQALFVHAGKLQEARKAAEAGRTKGAKADVLAKIDEEQKKIDAELVPLFDEMKTVALKVQAFDPANSDVFIIQAHSIKGMGDISGDPKVKTEAQNRTLEMLTAGQNMPVEVSDVAVTLGDGEAKLTGVLKTLKATPGSPVKLKVTVVDINGAPIGTQEITVAAPAVGATANFEGTAKLTGSLAGWRYEVVK